MSEENLAVTVDMSELSNELVENKKTQDTYETLDSLKNVASNVMSLVTQIQAHLLKMEPIVDDIRYYI